MTLSKLIALLDIEQRKRFCELAGTKHTHLWQLLGGHRSPSLAMLWALVSASRQMHPRNRRRWLKLERLFLELRRAQRNRERQRARQGATT